MNYCMTLFRVHLFASDGCHTAVVVMGGVICCSLIWYYFPVYGGVHWFTGPVRNVERVPSTKGSTTVETEDEKDKKDTASDE